MTMPHKTQPFLEKFEASRQKMKSELSEAVQAFGGSCLNIMKTGALNGAPGKKERELVTPRITVAQRWESCIVPHASRGLEAGNLPAEIINVASAAAMMQGGPTFTRVPVVIDALEARRGKS
jgi:alkylhydroperoxidase/carboxymuconolactone decarboxylase family protein YurZ